MRETRTVGSASRHRNCGSVPQKQYQRAEEKFGAMRGIGFFDPRDERARLRSLKPLERAVYGLAKYELAKTDGRLRGCIVAFNDEPLVGDQLKAYIRTELACGLKHPTLPAIGEAVEELFHKKHFEVVPLDGVKHTRVRGYGADQDRALKRFLAGLAQAAYTNPGDEELQDVTREPRNGRAAHTNVDNLGISREVIPNGKDGVIRESAQVYSGQSPTHVHAGGVAVAAHASDTRPTDGEQTAHTNPPSEELQDVSHGNGAEAVAPRERAHGTNQPARSTTTNGETPTAAPTPSAAASPPDQPAALGACSQPTQPEPPQLRVFRGPQAAGQILRELKLRTNQPEPKMGNGDGESDGGDAAAEGVGAAVGWVRPSQERLTKTANWFAKATCDQGHVRLFRRDLEILWSTEKGFDASQRVAAELQSQVQSYALHPQTIPANWNPGKWVTGRLMDAITDLGLAKWVAGKWVAA